MDIDKIMNAMICDGYSVSFANMGHGESIIIKIGSQTYLRDFGEWTRKREDAKDCNVKRILDQNNFCDFTDSIYHQSNSNYNAILSHPHKDHFSGFRKCFDNFNKIKNKRSIPIFKNAYIPRLVSTPKDVLVAQVLYECAANSYIFSNREEFLSLGINFIEFVFVMRALSQNLHHCSANKPSSTPFRCLLPKDSIASDNYGKSKKTASSCLNDFYQKNNISENDQKEIRELVNSIWDNVLPYLDIESQKNDKSECKDINPADEIFRRITDIRQKLNELKEKIKNNYPNQRFKVSDIFNYLKNKLDDASLAFDINIYDDQGYWLFLGDNGDNAIKSIFSNLKERYFGIKAAHHGTRTGGCLSKHTQADICVCCTGKGHQNLLPVDQEYIAVSNYCYALDAPKNCYNNCMASRGINVLCKSLVTFYGCNPNFAVDIICKNCP